jgi:hypothetical protein
MPAKEKTREGVVGGEEERGIRYRISVALVPGGGICDRILAVPHPRTDAGEERHCWGRSGGALAATR